MTVIDREHNILKLYRAAALMINKKSVWKDMEYYADPEDDDLTDIQKNSPEERMEYYLGGDHPDNINFDDPDLEPEDFELKEPAFRFDPKEHLEEGGNIIGKDDAPYIEDEEGKHYDIYPEDREILEQEEGELNPLDEIESDIPDFDLTPEDKEYIRALKIEE